MARNKPRKIETSAPLTVKGVAALDNRSEKAVRRAIAAGLLPAVRVGPGGRLLRIDPAAQRADRALMGA